MTPTNATEPAAPDVVIRLTGETMIGMHQAALLAGQGHSSTPTRWCQRGIRLANGTRIKLECLRSGGRLLTSKEAVMRFLAAQNAPAEPAGALAPPAPRRRKSKASAQVDRYLNLTDVIPAVPVVNGMS